MAGTFSRIVIETKPELANLLKRQCRAKGISLKTHIEPVLEAFAAREEAEAKAQEQGVKAQ